MNEADKSRPPAEVRKSKNYRSDRLSSVIWALILIYAGCVVLATSLGYLDAYLAQMPSPAFWDPEVKVLTAWPLIILGAAALLLVEIIIRLLVPRYRRRLAPTVILAILFVGLAGFSGWEIIVLLALIGLGIIVLGRALRTT